MHQTGASRELWFIYDENGQPYILISKEGSDVQVYWYLINAFGDVIGLLNSTQQIVATYRYDPYGRIIDEWINPTDDIGTINPLRYRGYYYDSVLMLFLNMKIGKQQMNDIVMNYYRICK